MIAEQNFDDHLHGDTFDGKEFEIIINGDPKDLTGTTIKIDFKKQKKTGALAKSLTNGSGITVTDATAGKFEIDPFVVDFAPGIYYFDIQFKDGNVVKTYIQGNWTIVQDVTD